MNVVSLGSSNGVRVETVGWEKMQKKLERLDVLREIGLNNANVAFGEGSIISTALPLVEDVDLSRNLLSGIEAVADICVHLPNLRILRLNHNRFKVRVLTLDTSLLLWEQLNELDPHFPALEEIHARNNRICSLEAPLTTLSWSNIKVIDLEHNAIQDWMQVEQLGVLSSLANLNIAHNQISSTRVPQTGHFVSLATLNVSHNSIKSWEDVHHLNSFPALVNIRLAGNPVSDGLDNENRLVVLTARLAKAVRIGGSFISAADRQDAECYYLSQAHLHLGEPDFERTHPRYHELCKRHGTPTSKKADRTIADGLLSLCLKGPGGNVAKKISKHSTLRVLKTILARTVWPKEWQKAVRGRLLWIKEDGETVDLSLTDDMKTLDYCEVVSGCVFTIEFDDAL
ncbi:hypothetical protein HDU91_005543 [Kappamyces sp. JEL0680]|nr:hypothetical protein HDU91_005543 [Kappamyces sp. JEL0680]